MFLKIMTPVDLAHLGALEKVLQCTADLARQHAANVVYVGVTTSTPSATAHTPGEYRHKLEKFAAGQGKTHGITTTADAIITHDPVTDIDGALVRASRDTGADLVVMASHLPNVMDHIWPSNGGKIAEHAKCSVLVIRA